ncbi:MAG: hypothetical protein LUF02_09335 [Erysipelotrichaceae bacterium]|nr:hypothetical protein [Erysipelotrichaceae bacterium]
MQLTKFIHCFNMHNNSYVIIDKKIVIIDAVDSCDAHDWLIQIDKLLSNRQPDYFIMTHYYQTIAIVSLCHKYPNMKLISICDALLVSKNIYTIYDHDMLDLGQHTLLLKVFKDMILIYNIENKILFSSLVFSLEDKQQSWNEGARYYYAKNVNHYGLSLLNFIKSLNYTMICPYIGQIMTYDLGQYIRYYELWIKCIPEEDGVFILTDSHNNNHEACRYLYKELLDHGDNAILYDIQNKDMIYVFSEMLKYDRIIIGSYISAIKPILQHLQNRVVGGIFDDIIQADELKKSIAGLNNILLKPHLHRVRH